MKQRWYPELHHFNPDTPVLLVGTKTDLRRGDDPDLDHVSCTEGEDLAESIGAESYMKCSAKTQEGMKHVFDTAIRIVLNPRRSSEDAKGARRKQCAIV